ncbi:MAG: translation initiation factor IF-2 [Clostridia bacterium]|nr:translation initiation factor IF-2 [Clostridia bacterium]
MNNNTNTNENKTQQGYNIDNLKQLSTIKSQGTIINVLNNVRHARQEVDKVLRLAQEKYDNIVKKAQAIELANALPKTDDIVKIQDAEVKIVVNEKSTEIDVSKTPVQEVSTLPPQNIETQSELIEKPTDKVLTNSQMTTEIDPSKASISNQDVNLQGQNENKRLNYVNRSQNSNYQGRNNYNKPQGAGYQGQSPNSNYQSRPQGTGYQGQNPNPNYQNNRTFPPRPYTPNATGTTGYQGARPQGVGYQGQNPNPNYQNNRTFPPRPYTPNATGTTGYQGNRNTQTRTFNGDNRFSKPQNANISPVSRILGDQSFAISADELRGPERTIGNKKKTSDRTHDLEKKTSSKRVLLRMGILNDEVDDDIISNRRLRSSKKLKEHIQIIQPPVEHAIITTKNLTVKILSEKIGKPVAEIIKKFMLLGMMVTINTVIDFEAAELIAGEFKITLEQKLDKTFEEQLKDNQIEEVDKQEKLQPRPPVVTIMGHVDHGKTSLLDAIRSTNVVEGESGGITQHIGAYTVKVDDRIITFIDTPGHEAFTAMRARGAKVTDVAILVVAADDGVMPQTVEAINHIKSAKVPMIVAINKIDKAGADVDRIKQQLTEHNLLAEEWGGDTIMVPISAKQQLNIDKLLETILLVADVQELKANYERKASGTIIESRLDNAKGPIATILVQNGTLNVGDTIVAGLSTGRIRVLENDKGQKIKSAGPSTPVSVTGLDSVPVAGDFVFAVDEKMSKQLVEERKNKVMADKILHSGVATTLEDLQKKVEESKLKNINIIIKADVQGSIEALKNSLEALSNQEVKVNCIHSAVGNITETDALLASATGAMIVGFNVKPDSGAREIIERDKIKIKIYNIIYEAVEDLKIAVLGLKERIYQEVFIGRATIRAVFKISSVGVIAGSYITDGKFVRGAKAIIMRAGQKIGEGKILSLKIQKDEKKEVAVGYECGVKLDKFSDFKEDDTIECYITQEVL